MAKLEIVKHCIAADIAKKDFKVCYMVVDKKLKTAVKATKTFLNTVKGIEEFLAYIEDKRVSNTIPLTVVVEATGVYHENFAYMVYDAGLDLKIILPTKISHYKMSFSQNSKTDKIDAKMLAQYGLERGYLEQSWEPCSMNTLKLKRLCRERKQLQQDLTAQNNRLHAIKHCANPEQSTIDRLEQHIVFLDTMIKAVEKEIKETINKDEAIKEKVSLLVSIPGVGLTTAAIVLAETDCFALFNSVSQLTRYAGYDVIYTESGTSVNRKTRISKRGNSHIRAALHFPAMTASRIDGVFKNLKERVFDRTALKMKGNVAVQRKLLCIMFALIKNNEKYDAQKHLDRAISASEVLSEALVAQ